jgi:F0F1-type ATP synthase membrane subunit c/vacuolar-type H+-ATPase subunit K
MAGLSRRIFLRNGTLGVMAAGVASAVPGLGALVTAAAVDGPALDSSVAGVAENPSLDSDIVAHVRDLGTGEIAVYRGTQEVIFRDPAVAARLFQATR